SEQQGRVEFRQIYSPLNLENISSYLAITTVIGLISIYAGFRGTVTAGFQFQHEVWRVFLLTPLILFVPGTLFYDYYPRYVLRKIVQHKVFELMMRLGASGGSNASTAESHSSAGAKASDEAWPIGNPICCCSDYYPQDK